MLNGARTTITTNEGNLWDPCSEGPSFTERHAKKHEKRKVVGKIGLMTTPIERAPTRPAHALNNMWSNELLYYRHFILSENLSKNDIVQDQIHDKKHLIKYRGPPMSSLHTIYKTHERQSSMDESKSEISSHSSAEAPMFSSFSIDRVYKQPAIIRNPKPKPQIKIETPKLYDPTLPYPPVRSTPSTARTHQRTKSRSDATPQAFSTFHDFGEQKESTTQIASGNVTPSTRPSTAPLHAHHPVKPANATPVAPSTVTTGLPPSHPSTIKSAGATFTQSKPVYSRVQCHSAGARTARTMSKPAPKFIPTPQ